MGGFMVGGVVTLRWKPRHGLLIGTVLLALTGLFPVAMALSDQLPVAAARRVPARLRAGDLQRQLGPVHPDRRWPRTSWRGSTAFDIVGSFVARPLGLVLVGPITAVTGIGPWLITVAVIMAGTSLLAATVPSVRRLERRA